MSESFKELAERCRRDAGHSDTERRENYYKLAEGFGRAAQIEEAAREYISIHGMKHDRLRSMPEQIAVTARLMALQGALAQTETEPHSCENCGHLHEDGNNGP